MSNISSVPLAAYMSSSAYRECVDSGWLAKMNAKVYAAICEHAAKEPLTRNELYYIVDPDHHNAEGSYGRRVTDLIHFGYVYHPGYRICRRSNIENSVLAPTGYRGPVPTEFVGPAPTHEEKREVGAKLQKLIDAASAQGRAVDPILQHVVRYLVSSGVHFEPPGFDPEKDRLKYPGLTREASAKAG